MGVNYTGPKPGRNDLCPCGSGLKHKYCHGDSGKVALCNRIVGEFMSRLIQKERHDRGISTDEEYQEFLDICNPKMLPKVVTEHDVDEILDKANLKRCAGALCGAPIPDTEEFCIQCKLKYIGG